MGDEDGEERMGHAGHEYDDALVIAILNGPLECDRTDAKSGLTVLQQCIEKQLYNTLRVLIEERRADIHYKSTKLQYDALHYAVRVADTTAILLLLHLNANINATDASGLTPIVWTLINDPYSVCVQRLLLVHGCSLQATDPYGNTCLHLLAYRSGVNCDLSFMLITANNSSSGADDSSNDSNSKILLQTRNNDDLIPFDVARKENNRQLAQLLEEVVQFITWPKYVPFAAAFGFAFTYAFVLLPLLGIFYSTIFAAAASFAAAPVFQMRIRRHLHRAFLGASLGYLFIVIATYAFYIDFLISTNWSRTFYMAFFTSVYLSYKMHRSKPQSPSLSKGSATDDVVQGLLSTADDYETVRKVMGTDSMGQCEGGSSQIIDVISSTQPYLCSQCLCNKKLHNVSAHCNFCGMCVVSQDQHSFLFSTCVGRGNVRLFFVSLVLLFYVLAMYMSLSLQVYNSEYYCNNATGILFNSFAVGGCLYSKFPLLFINAFLSFYFLASVLIQILSQLFVIANETTIYHILYKKHNSNSFHNKLSYHISNVVKFLLTGVSNNSYVMSHADYLQEDGEVDVYAYKRFNHMQIDRDRYVHYSESDIKKVVQKERVESGASGCHNHNRNECCNRKEDAEAPLLSTEAVTIDYRDR